MLRFTSALLLVGASIAPAHAITIIVNPNATAVTGSSAVVFRDFTTANASGTTLTTITNGTFGVNKTFSDTKFTNPTGQNPGFVNTRDTAVAPLAGMAGDYLAIGRLSSYTFSFIANPISYFSFVFNGVDQNSSLVFSYVGGTTQTFSGRNMLGGAANNLAFGRVNYHTGTGPQILSVMFRRANTGQGAFTVDSFAAAVPEPATWLMMILGFGLVGRQLRRRKAKATLAVA